MSMISPFQFSIIYAAFCLSIKCCFWLYFSYKRSRAETLKIAGVVFLQADAIVTSNQHY